MSLNSIFKEKEEEEGNNNNNNKRKRNRKNKEQRRRTKRVAGVQDLGKTKKTERTKQKTMMMK